VDLYLARNCRHVSLFSNLFHCYPSAHALSHSFANTLETMLRTSDAWAKHHQVASQTSMRNTGLSGIMRAIEADPDLPDMQQPDGIRGITLHKYQRCEQLSGRGLPPYTTLQGWYMLLQLRGAPTPACCAAPARGTKACCAATVAGSHAQVQHCMQAGSQVDGGHGKLQPQGQAVDTAGQKGSLQKDTM
jgi:hypothetical protein